MYSASILLFFLHFHSSNIYTFGNEITSNTTKIWTIYYPHQFDRNKHCHTLRCSSDELCVVNEKTARCVKNDKLHDVDGFHVDFTSGKLIYHDDQEKSHYRNSRIQSSKHKHEHLPRHYEHIETTNYECDEKKLHSIGGRLLQWFSEMHKLATIDSGLPLHKHKTMCRKDVAWMFQQWDGNNDGELSIKELIPLETDLNEKCLKAYIDRCDTEPGNDNVITLDEWCDCFAWADNDRHEPPCHAAKHQQDPHLLGTFHPRCTLEGYYKAEQCHENFCWCVDKYGREFDNSRVMGGLPDCGQYATEMDENEKEELMAEL
ncbi:Thyroglobulin type-1 repeat family protein [Brugia malayi]|uniref:Thyroglobulin type-1 repeat family protein n=2 Tax=Brugia TaxID=6278 RepID=A0A4E9FQ26_BRUMA|nr:Thyroglobulin type-1 repeat family protein [Brugia malayi]VIO99194.1 Thyroglobulin type-1 repeat family protein [Brugia malayi]